MAKKTVVVCKLESVSPQRQQYKPYAFNALPQDVYLEIEIPPDGIVSQSSGETVLNMEGFQAILSALADGVDEVHEAYVIRQRRTGKI